MEQLELTFSAEDSPARTSQWLDAALVVRHPRPLDPQDLQSLLALAEEKNLQLYLQPKGPDSRKRVNGDQQRLYFQLAEQQLRLGFHPGDFTQINADINQAMVTQALALLQPEANDRILDLFCGLGNFTLPLATRAGQVVGVEGSEQMVQRVEHVL